MKSLALYRSIASAALVLSGLSLLHCDKANCESLRDDLYAQKLAWQQCKTSADCQIIGGNTQDCTGILSCNLAINVRHREEAERRIASLPEESVECHKCGSPNCPTGDIPYCDPATHTCVVVDSFLGGDGGASMGFEPPATGGRGSGGSGSGGYAGSGGSGGSGGSAGLPADPNNPLP
jgi:uncharacterized membrane protein YgcG